MKPKRLKYTPKDGAVVMDGALARSATYPAGEAKRLIATGAFEIVKPEKEVK